MQATAPARNVAVNLCICDITSHAFIGNARLHIAGPSMRILVLAGQEGIEPPTFGFGDRRSAN